MVARTFALLVVFACQAGAVWGQDRAIVVLGDSLSSGYGLGSAPSWVEMLENALEARGYGYDVVNASRSGETSAGGLARLPDLLVTQEPSIVVIALGGNDGLRGQPVDALRGNLARMIELVRVADGIPVLAGMKLPDLYGPEYSSAFARVYPELAAHYAIPLIGLLLEGVALRPEFMMGDGIHPNADGQRVILQNVWAVLTAER